MFTIARKMERMIAQRNPSTEKPGTIASVSKIRIAFITIVKSPSVISVIGRVRIKRTGFINAFIIPKTSAVTRADVKLST